MIPFNSRLYVNATHMNQSITPPYMAYNYIETIHVIFFYFYIDNEKPKFHYKFISVCLYFSTVKSKILNK